MSPIRLPSTDALRAFEAAARLGTFERAAEELAVTASAVGKRVVNLEELLGVPLLVRSGKLLALTAAGREYLEQVRQVLALLMAVPLHHASVQRAERLRIRTTPTFARQVMVRHLRSFLDAQPALELEIVLSVPYLGSEADGEDVDVEVRTGDAALAPPGSTPLMNDVVMPMASPDLIRRVGGLRTPHDLRRAPLLRTPLDPWRRWFEAAGLDAQEPLTGPRLVDLGLTIEAALGGVGVALVRPTLAHEWIAEGRLVPLFDIAAVPQQQYQVLRHGEADCARAFETWLRGQCRQAEAAGAAAVRAHFDRPR